MQTSAAMEMQRRCSFPVDPYLLSSSLESGLAMSESPSPSQTDSRRDSVDSGAPDSSSGSGSPSDCDSSPSHAAPQPSEDAMTPEPEPDRRRRRKKKRLPSQNFCSTRFRDSYYLNGHVLGEGSNGRVETCVNMYTDVEYAVKIMSKASWTFSRAKVLKEVELYYLCQGRSQIIQLVEYFEEPDYFYFIFEKAHGGPLLDQIQKRVHFTEQEAAAIIKDLALALSFLHQRGIAHRDLKPENILCVNANSPWPVKLCDFDLCSSVSQKVSTPMLQSPVGSAEYMAPEVVNAFATMDLYDDDDELTYDKRCDLWSLGIITYILLCGYLPFTGHCDDPSCGWESGEECLKCQRSLFHAIRTGTLVFPEQHWAAISAEAKDLISRLLVKEASQRMDAEALLKHPWIVRGGSAEHLLETPSVLRRQISVKEFSEFATNALAIKRNMEKTILAKKPGRFGSVNNDNAMRKSATSNDLVAADRKLGAKATSGLSSGMASGFGRNSYAAAIRVT